MLDREYLVGQWLLKSPDWRPRTCTWHSPTLSSRLMGGKIILNFCQFVKSSKLAQWLCI